VFRDAGQPFSREAYWRTCEQLELRLSQRQACLGIVALLEMVGRNGVEDVPTQQLDELLVAGEPDVKRLREEFAKHKTEVPQVNVQIWPAASDDALLPSAQETPEFKHEGAAA